MTTLITPTLLLHLGIGYNSDDLGRPLVTPNYNACTNLEPVQPGVHPTVRFSQLHGSPRFHGRRHGKRCCATAGDIGNTGRTDSIYNQFNSIASLTWVKGNHTFKFGGELRSQGNYSVDHTDLQGSYGFSDAQTAMPYVVTTVGGVSAANIGAYHIGQPYASFLLGYVNTATLDPTSDSRFGKHSLAGYMQDSWKVTRKFTLELGIRDHLPARPVFTTFMPASPTIRSADCLIMACQDECRSAAAMTMIKTGQFTERNLWLAASLHYIAITL